jgi:hypothetical protein
MKISQLIELLQKYDGELEVTTLKQVPTSSDFVDHEMLTKFGLEISSQRQKAEIVGSVLEVDLVIMKTE